MLVFRFYFSATGCFASSMSFFKTRIAAQRVPVWVQ
jgi:hypothetical protein